LTEHFIFSALTDAFLILAGFESRAHSIKRENKYLARHPVQKVAKCWPKVLWATVDGFPLTVDISAPEGQGPFPCVMIIHGGGWMLHTSDIMEGMARYITNHCYVVFNINYRVLPDVKMEQIVNDVIGALIWVKEHAAEYGGDPKKVAITGDSAGGHLTAMILTQAGNPAFTPSYKGNGKTDLSVTCAAPSYGMFDFTGLGKFIPFAPKLYFGETYRQAPDRYQLLSPLLHVKPGLPPQLISVGSIDPLFRQNQKYAEALKIAGNQVEFWVHKGQTHAFLNYYWDNRGTRGYDKIIEFFDRNLKK